MQHSFVKQLGAGTLPMENFLHFVKYVDLLVRTFIAVLTRGLGKTTIISGIMHELMGPSLYASKELQRRC